MDCSPCSPDILGNWALTIMEMSLFRKQHRLFELIFYVLKNQFSVMLGCILGC